MTPSSPKRIGLLGGTFDPIHIGHLRAALEARKKLDLDEVCLIPAARPPHKADRRTAISQNRLTMLQSAVKGVDGLTVSDLELHRDGPSYTLDTVTAFLTGADSSATFFLMMGLDAFLEFDTWYRYKVLLKKIPIAVICRPGRWGFSISEMRQSLQNYLLKTLSPEYRQDDENSCFVHDVYKPVHLVDIPLLEISATAIRRRIKQNEPITYLVPPMVVDYIVDQGLYR